MSRRKWEVDLSDPDKFQLIVGEKPNQYYIRISCLGISFLSRFIEDIEDTYKRKTRILEFGDGLSTVWFARNFPDNEFISVGGDEWWYNWVEELLAKEAPHHIKHVFHKATNMYTTEQDENLDYTHTLDEFECPYDLIINDGAQREILGDYILSNPDKYISPGGIYLRHDYEMAIVGNWVGLRDQLPSWCRDDKDLGYEGFCATHPDYNLITTTGNGLAGYVSEFGGVWRKVDHQWQRKLGVEAERKNHELNNQA